MRDNKEATDALLTRAAEVMQEARDDLWHHDGTHIGCEQCDAVQKLEAEIAALNKQLGR